jgi:membrane fusion protein, multidrug efflux system
MRTRKRAHSASLFRTVLAAALVAALGASAVGCAEKEARASTSATADTQPTTGPIKAVTAAETELPVPRAANVEVAELEPSTVSEVISANGVAQAVSDIVYSAELSGKIEYLPVEIGDRVRKGQVIARIDFRTLSAQASQVEATYGLSKTTLERLQSLETDDLVSKQQMDEVRSQMASAESQRALIRTELAKAIVHADRPGVVANVFAERSEYVGPGAPIAQIVDLREMIVETRLAETQVGGVTKGAAAEVEVDALGKKFAGVVEAVVPAADKDSRTFTVRVKVKNPEERILVGMSARVRIAVRELKDVIAVPQSAVLEGKDGRSVFVASGGKAERRRVALGAVDGDRVVLLEGVRPGEQLVVVGHRDLTDGQAITVVR